MARNIVHILDIGSASLKVLSAQRRPEEAGLHILGAALVPAEGVRRGLVQVPSLLSKKIKEAVREVERFSGIPFKHAYVVFGSPALGFQKVRSRVAISQASGEVSPYDVDRVLSQARPSSRELQNRGVMEFFGLNYAVDSEFSLKDPVGLKGEHLEAEVLFVTSLLKPLNEAISAVEEAGVAIDDVVPAPLATARALLASRQREAGALVMDIGAETLNLAVFEENLPYSLAVFPFGGAHITNDIALGFQVPLEKAEEIKISAKLPDDSAPSKRKFQNIVEARLEDMFELVQAHLKKIGRAGLLPGGVVLSGGSAKIQGLEEFSRNALRLPAELGVCRELDSSHKLQDLVWQTALGAALLALDQETSPAFKKPSALRQRLSSWLRSLIP